MKRLHYIIFGFLFVLYFFCYYGVLSHVLFYHEQHHLFLFSCDYFRQCVASESLLSYLTAFVILPYSGIGQRPAGSYHRIRVSAKPSDYPENFRRKRPITTFPAPLVGIVFLYDVCRPGSDTCNRLLSNSNVVVFRAFAYTTVLESFSTF